MSRPWVIAGSIVVLFFVACFAVLAYAATRYKNYSAPSESMAPTIRTGDMFFVDRFAYQTSAPQRGDVIVFFPPIPSPNAFVKRIVALPGDRYAIHRGRAILNGAVVREPYIEEPAGYELAIRDYRLWVEGAPLDPSTAMVPPRSDWTASLPRPHRAVQQTRRGGRPRVAATVREGPEVALRPRRGAQLPTGFGSRQARSNGSRHACGATSWWIDFGPHEPGGYRRTGGGESSSGIEASHSRSIPSAVVNSV